MLREQEKPGGEGQGQEGQASQGAGRDKDVAIVGKSANSKVAPYR